MFSYLWQKNEFQQTWKENDSNLRNILAKLNLAVFIASVQSKKVDCRSKNFSKGVKLNGILGRIKPEGINYVP